MAIKQFFVDDYSSEIIDPDLDGGINHVTITIEGSSYGDRTYNLDLGDMSMHEFMETTHGFLVAAVNSEPAEIAEDTPVAIDPSTIKVRVEKYAGKVPLLSARKAKAIKPNKHGVKQMSAKLCSQLQNGGRLKVRTAVSRANAFQMQQTAAKHGIQLVFENTHKTKADSGFVTYFGDVYAEMASA